MSNSSASNPPKDPLGGRPPQRPDNNGNNGDNQGPQNWFTKFGVWVVIALILSMLFNKLDIKNSGASANTVGYSEFLELVRAKNIKQVSMSEGGGNNDISSHPHT